MTLEKYASNPLNCVFADTLKNYRLIYNSYDYGFLTGYLIAMKECNKISDFDFNTLFLELDRIHH